MTDPHALPLPDLNKETLEEFKARLAALNAAWPYDESKDLTEEQLKALGAVDVTQTGLGIVITGS